MLSVVSMLLASVSAWFRSRLSVQMELLALRHQVAVYKQSVSRPKLRPTDRLLWVWLLRLWPGWQEVLAFVQPRRDRLAEEATPQLLATAQLERQTGTAGHRETGPQADPRYVAVNDLGLASYCRGAAEAWYRCRQIDCGEISAKGP
jgi:hypothetical protein